MKNNIQGPIAWKESPKTSQNSPEAIIFLHAMAGSATAWAPQIAAFSDAYRCVAWDMPGFGDSADPTNNLDMDGVVSALALFVSDQLGLSSAHFVGLSVGGMILQHFAAAHPEMTKSIVILDSSPKFGFGGTMKPSEFADPILSSLLSGTTTPKEFSEGMVRSIVGPECVETVKQECIAAMSRSRISGLALTTRLIADHDALNILPLITCPTLVMAGENDTETPPAYAYEIGRRIPNASITVIPKSGHIVNLENPEAVNVRLQFFLDQAL